jgi:transposase
VRREFYELAESQPVAADVLRRVALLYASGGEIRGLSCRRAQPSARLAQPHDAGRTLQIPRTSRPTGRAKCRRREAIRNMFLRCDGHFCVLDNGRTDIDSRAVERTIRPLALNRKNARCLG